jgi:nucleoside-diphosphate-sugar epimerase
MKTVIAGCGYVGTALYKNLALEGHEVAAFRRDIGTLEAAGFEAYAADFTKPETMKYLPPAAFAVFAQAPSQETDDYESTYLRSTENLLAALKDKISRHVILISSTSVYGQRDGGWVDETTDPIKDGYENEDAAKKASILLESEKRVLDAGGVVLRLGGIYGPGRHRLAALKSGKMKAVPSAAWINRIRVEDIVSAIRILMEKGKPGEIYLGVDDKPTTQREFYYWVAAELGIELAPEAPAAGPHASNKRCSNKKLKALGFRPKFPTFREGYSELVKAVVSAPPPKKF